MRPYAALAALILVACAADPAIAPRDCTPGTSAPCACPGASGVQTCTAEGRVGACVCPDGGALADAGDASSPAEDRPAPLDVAAAPDVVSGPDVVDAGSAGPDVVDAGAADVDPRQTPECRAVTQTCDGRTVNVQGGEVDGGVTYHCGRCGNTCPAGFGCLTCVCIRL